jgi:hypothetical protein
MIEAKLFPQLNSFGKKSIDVESANQLRFRKSGFHKGSFADEIRICESELEGSGLHGAG